MASEGKTQRDRRHDEKRRQEKPWRKLYNTKRWQDLRLARLVAEPICRTCLGVGRVEPATVVDHVKPHRGDFTLFFDYENTQSLCRPHHDTDARIKDRTGHSVVTGPDGFPIDPNHPFNKGR